MKKIVIIALSVILVAVLGILTYFLTKEDDTPWKWAQNFHADAGVSGYTWCYEREMPMSRDELAYVAPLLNRLEKSDFTENTAPEGIAPEYGIKLTEKATIIINQVDSPYGEIEIIYNGKQWWIDDRELAMFVYKAYEGAKSDISFDPGVALLAEGYIREQITNLADVLKTRGRCSVKIQEAQITKLERTATFDGIVHFPVELWLLEYKLLPDCGVDNVVLPDRSTSKDGWLVNSSNDEQTYMLVEYYYVKPSCLYGVINTQDINEAGSMKNAVIRKLTEQGMIQDRLDETVTANEPQKAVLTLNDVRALAKKENSLTFEDFILFQGANVSNTLNHYLVVYAVEGGYRLIIDSDGHTVGRADLERIWDSGGSGIDIRFSDVDEFIKSHPSTEVRTN